MILNKDANSAVIYNGKVTITQLHGKSLIKRYVVKNNGSELFLKLLTQCVCGFDVSKNMPKYLSVGVYNSGVYKSVLASRVDVTQEFVQVDIDGDKNTYAAKFTAIIPPSIVISSERKTEVNMLRLYSDYALSEEDSNLAYLSLQDDQKLSFSESSYTTIVEWYMYFTNSSN